MALIKCEDCGKEFSDKASACPNCGCPNKKIKVKTKQSKTINKTALKSKNAIIIIVSVIVFVIVIIGLSSSNKPKLAGTYYKEHDVYKSYITLYEYGDCKWSVYSGADLIWEYSDGYVLIKTTNNSNKNLGVCKYKNKTLECKDNGSMSTSDGIYVLK